MIKAGGIPGRGVMTIATGIGGSNVTCRFAMTGGTRLRGTAVVKMHRRPVDRAMTRITGGRGGDVTRRFVMAGTAWLRHRTMVKAAHCPTVGRMTGITLGCGLYVATGFVVTGATRLSYAGVIKLHPGPGRRVMATITRRRRYKMPIRLRVTTAAR